MRTQPIVRRKFFRDVTGEQGGFLTVSEQGKRHQADCLVTQVATECKVVVRIICFQLRSLFDQVLCHVAAADQGIGGGKQPAAHRLQRFIFFQAVHSAYFRRLSQGEDIEAIGLRHLFRTGIIGVDGLPVACHTAKIIQDIPFHAVGHQISFRLGRKQEVGGIDRSPGIAAGSAGPVRECTVYRLVRTQATDDFLNGVSGRCLLRLRQSSKFTDVQLRETFGGDLFDASVRITDQI